MLRTRYRRIVLFFTRVAISLIVWELALPRLGFRRRAKRTRSERLRRIATAFRALAIEMGGVLIKVGQFLSARLDMLPEELRKIVMLCEFSELSYEEIAGILSIPAGTVGSRRNRALRKLKEMLSEEGNGDAR